MIAIYFILVVLVLMPFSGASKKEFGLMNEAIVCVCALAWPLLFVAIICMALYLAYQTIRSRP